MKAAGENTDLDSHQLVRDFGAVAAVRIVR
jgi:hypothetical protein